MQKAFRIIPIIDVSRGLNRPAQFWCLRQTQVQSIAQVFDSAPVRGLRRSGALGGSVSAEGRGSPTPLTFCNGQVGKSPSAPSERCRGHPL